MDADPTVFEDIYIIKGHVQGVGFRWNARRIAMSLGISGLVRNLPNGDVEMNARASRRQIDQLVAHLRETFHVEQFELKSRRSVEESVSSISFEIIQ
ncbi:MAG: acylphosphatase [Planctomycetes bacterium]|nr:acylphosphatase [Planctomycetota bacterium]